MNRLVNFFVFPILMFQMTMTPGMARWALGIIILSVCGGIGIGKVLFGQ